MTSELVPSKHSTNKPVTPPNNDNNQASNPTIVSLLEPNKGLKKATHDWDAECKPPIGSNECFSTLPAPFCYANHLSYWTVDEDATKFWNKYGKKIALKNLFISIPNLLLSFSVWMIWSVISVLLYNAWSDTCLTDTNTKCHYSFTTWYDSDHIDETTYKSTLWLLPATAGLSGATLRLTNSFMIAPSGGRIVISQTAVISLISQILLAIGLNDINVSLEYLIIVALITGCGGGAFASSMSNISFFFPNSKEGIALGLNAGIGNLGVSVMQILIAGITSYSAFGSAGSINVNGVYIANAAIIWIPFLIIFMIAAFLFMNSLPKHETAAGNGNTLLAFTSYYWLEFLGYIGSSCAVIILIFVHKYMMKPGYDILLGILLWFICVSVTVACMKFLMFCKFLRGAHDNIKKTMAILKMPNTWIMTHLYIMTFGSFIGFSASFPMLIQQLYPNKNPLFYAWLGPFVGSVARPIGGWLSDRVGGATVTHFDVLVMIAATIGVGIAIVFNIEFPLFLILFLLLFITTGIGNGSTFRMIPQIFTNKEHAGPVLGWTSAIAAYGAFIIPMIFKASIALGGAEWAFFGFAFYYFTCLQVNWYFYYRKCWCRPCATRERVNF